MARAVAAAEAEEVKLRIEAVSSAAVQLSVREHFPRRAAPSLSPPPTSASGACDEMSALRSAAAVRDEDLTLHAAGIVRCEGPIMHTRPRRHPSPRLVEEWKADWARRSPDLVRLMQQPHLRLELAALFRSLALSPGSALAGLHMWDLVGWRWSDFAARGMLPPTPDEHDGSSRWLLSRELAEQIIAALAGAPPKPWDLLIGVAYFRVWREDPDAEGGAEAEAETEPRRRTSGEPAWIGYACGEADCPYRDDNVYFRLRQVSDAESPSTWEDEWSTSEDEFGYWESHSEVTGGDPTAPEAAPEWPLLRPHALTPRLRLAWMVNGGAFVYGYYWLAYLVLVTAPAEEEALNEWSASVEVTLFTSLASTWLVLDAIKVCMATVLSSEVISSLLSGRELSGISAVSGEEAATEGAVKKQKGLAPTRLLARFVFGILSTFLG
jgi:hypothetical protein